MKNQERRIAELEKELKKRQSGDAASESGDESSSEHQIDSKSALKSKKSKKKSEIESGSEDASSSSSSDDENEKSSEKDSNEEGSDHEDGEDALEPLDMKQLELLDLKTYLGQSKHHLKKAKDDLVYITFFPVKDLKYIALYSEPEEHEFIKKRNELRRDLAKEHTYEEAVETSKSRKYWSDDQTRFGTKNKTSKPSSSKPVSSAATASKPVSISAIASEMAKNAPAGTGKLNRKARRALAAKASGAVQFGKPDADSDGDGEDFFFDTEEAAAKAATKTKEREEQKKAENEAAMAAISDAARKRREDAQAELDEQARRRGSKATSSGEHLIFGASDEPDSASFSSKRHESSKGNKSSDKSDTKPQHKESVKSGSFSVPQDDTITASDFFGDDYESTGRYADVSWENQQKRAQRTGNREYRFMPSAPDYLTSRGRKRYGEEAPPLPQDGFTKKPWLMGQEREANQDTPYGFGGRSVRGAPRAGFRGGRGAGRGGRGGSGRGGASRGGFRNFSHGGDRSQAPSSSKMDVTRSSHNSGAGDEAQKKKRSRPKKKE